MKITLKMSGLVARYLPADSSNGVAEMDVAGGTTVAALMQQLGLPGEDSFLVILDDETVPRAQRDTKQLSDGSRISIVPPLKGG